MNLIAYDAVKNKIDKSKTWIDVKTKKLVSRELKYRKIVTLSKNYNTDNGDYDYFIILLDSPPVERMYVLTRVDDYGRIKISLNSIWKDDTFNNLTKDINVNMELVEHADDGDIYKIIL